MLSGTPLELVEINTLEYFGNSAKHLSPPLRNLWQRENIDFWYMHTTNSETWWLSTLNGEPPHMNSPVSARVAIPAPACRLEWSGYIDNANYDGLRMLSFTMAECSDDPAHLRVLETAKRTASLRV